MRFLENLGVDSSTKLGPNTIAIPIIDAGIRINTKYRTIAGEKRFLQEPNAKPVFWNIDRITDETLRDLPLIITEGEFDAIAAIQAGFGRVVSVPNGAPQREDEDSDARYKFLENAPKALHQCNEIILATDADRPGLVLMNDLALRLGRVRCRWVKYPAGCKDLADVLVKLGQRGVVETINRAQWFEIDGLYRMAELPPLPELTPLDSGFPGLRDHWKLREGDLSVVSGVPSSGKTTVVNNIACLMAIRHSWHTVFASFEQVPQRDHRRFLRTWYNGKLVVHQTPEEIDYADAWINRHFLFVSPGDDDEPTLEWVLDRLSTAVVRHGVKLCIIDPWNELSHERPGTMSMTDYIGFALRVLKRFARKHLVHVIVVAHPMKMRRLENGRFPTPCLYDIADSAHWLDVASRVEGASPGYPPFNIEKTGEDAYRLTMAVAGFSPSELDVTVHENTLLVTGKAQKEEEKKNGNGYLHRGIARRAFERRFSLADHMKVTGAKLDNGMLHVDLVHEVPEAAKPRKIAIGTGEPVQPQVTQQKAA